MWGCAALRLWAAFWDLCGSISELRYCGHHLQKESDGDGGMMKLLWLGEGVGWGRVGGDSVKCVGGGLDSRGWEIGGGSRGVLRSWWLRGWERSCVAGGMEGAGREGRLEDGRSWFSKERGIRLDSGGRRILLEWVGVGVVLMYVQLGVELGDRLCRWDVQRALRFGGFWDGGRGGWYGVCGWG
ncbi:hypothetical protein Tco_0158543 [Tanacetum coccineum]